MIWAVMGDADFFALALGLPHWASKRPCYECDASSSTANQGTYFKNLEMDTQAFTRVTPCTGIGTSLRFKSLVNAIPGLSMKFVRGDALHICFVHGAHASWGVSSTTCVGSTLKTKISPGAVSSGSLAKGIQRSGQPNQVEQSQAHHVHRPQEPSHLSLSIKGSEAKHILGGLQIIAAS